MDPNLGVAMILSDIHFQGLQVPFLEGIITEIREVEARNQMQLYWTDQTDQIVVVTVMIEPLTRIELFELKKCLY